MVLQDDSHAFEELYRRDRVRLGRFLLTLGASAEDADDIAQEAFVKLLRNWPQVDNREAWLRRTAQRELWQRWRRASLEQTKLSAMNAPPMGPTHPERLPNDNEFVLEVLRQMPPRQRAVMAWHLDGFSVQEISERLAIKPDLVSANLYQAKLRLRNLLSRTVAEVTP